MRPDADLAPLTGFASKMPGMVARVALALHVLEKSEANLMELATIRAACAWAEFLFGHARVVRGDAAEGTTTRLARRLLSAIHRRGMAYGSARDLYRLVHGESVPNVEVCGSLISELVERGYLRERPVLPGPRPGRSTSVTDL